MDNPTARARRAAVLGALFLVCCAVLTTFCAVVVEMNGMEPALRGLVHAGVMLLFAGICVEPFIDNSRSASCTETTPLEDAQGMGVVFAGLGILYLTWVGVVSLCRFLWMDESASFQLLLWFLMFIATSSSGVVVYWINLEPVIGCRHLFLWPPVATKSNEEYRRMNRGRTKSLASLSLFLLASAVSLLNTSHEMVKEQVSIYVLILDLMAFVFHRSFIGTMLVGAGFGTSHEIVEQNQRKNLRCRYRAFFSIVCINLAASWWVSQDRLASIGVLLAGLLQVDEAALFANQLWYMCTFSWPTQLWTLECGEIQQVVGGNKFDGYAYASAVASFTFYAGTLFVDGVLLYPESDLVSMRNGFDACLVKSVHVAAVLAAMIAIFPRLLLRVSDASSTTGRSQRLHNTIAKVVCASMSLMDVIICTWILLHLDTQNPNSRGRKIVLYLRTLGAILEAVTFAVLRISSNGAEPSATKPDGDMDSLVDSPSSTGGVSLHVDGFTVITWLVYFGAHAFHSCILPKGGEVLATEIQLSKIFHFQVITIGFYSSSILRSDPMSTTIVAVFSVFEILGVLSCGGSFVHTTADRLGMVLASSLLLLDCLCKLGRHDQQWKTSSRGRRNEGAGSVIFPS